jgi:hypothetical protein
MNTIKEFEGSISLENFAMSLLASDAKLTLGDVWEQHVKCDRCSFAEQCAAASDLLEAQGKYTTCGQTVDFLLGSLKAENIPVRK